MENEMLIERAARRLSNGNEEARYAAVKDLSGSGNLGAISFLIKAVGDESYRVRAEALKGICAFPAKDIFPRLEAFLRDNDNATLRNAAIEAFPRYGKQATLYLLKLLKDYDEEIRIFSAGMLGDLGDPAAVDELINALKDPDENVRHAAAESLGKIKDHRAVDPLIQCLNGDFWIQYPAIIALGEMCDPSAIAPLVKLLDEEMLRQPVIEALGKIGDISVIPLLAKMLSQNDLSIRNDTIAALVKIQSRVEGHILTDGLCLPSIKKSLQDEELIDHLLNSLHDSNHEVKKNAVIALGWLKQKKAVKDLIGLLNEYELEEYVTGSLVSIGHKALPELIEGLSIPDPKVRGSIIRCIGWIENVDGIKACLPFLHDGNSEVRYQAILAMAGALECEDIEDALLSLISDPDAEIRSVLIEVLGKSLSKSLASKLIPKMCEGSNNEKLTAIRILGRIKDKDAFESLRNLLNNDSDDIRGEVYKALSSIFPSRLTTEILLSGLSDKSPVVRKAIAGSLSMDGMDRLDDIEAELIPLLKDTDPDVRHMAVQTLGKMGSVSCVDSLIDVFNDGDKRIKIAVIRAMGNISNKACTHFLSELLKESDPDIKRNSLDSLGEIRDERSVPSLIIALDDADWSVRSAAISAMGKLQDKRCIGHLLDKLKDSEDIIKKEAIIALGRIGAIKSANFILPMIYNEALQLEVIQTLERLGTPDLKFFFNFFKRSDTRLKCILVDLQGRMKNTEAVDYLVKILDDEFYTVRAHAARALGQINDRRALSPLLKAQKEDPSEEVQKEAALALKKLDAGK